jgi:queuine tRNA-ribosyltransferase
MPPLSFDILHRAADCAARVGRVTTPHGSFDTPAFMPVGTQAAVKGLLPWDVAATGSQIILANTYHLMLRPGSELVAQMGGLHAWMRWPGPILTDSGGFQVFSLADVARVTDDGVVFKSHLDGATVELTPARSMRVQNDLGADIIMAFDDCPPAGGSGFGSRASGVGGDEALASSSESRPATLDPRPVPPSPRHAVPLADYPARVQLACERSLRWLDACIQAHARPADQALFGIVQGGTDLDRRAWCASRVTQHDLSGYAIGGVAVGEGYAGLKAVVEHTAPLLPADRPRYLMGVGYERDIVAAVRAGVDMFDCVLPTRNGRNANAFTSTGQIRVRNACFADDPRPIEEGCDCPACGGGAGLWSGVWGLESEQLPPEFRSGSRPRPEPRVPRPAALFSRSYLRHLFLAGEMLGPILVSLHNIRHFQRLLLDIRRAIRDNDWSLIRRNWPVVREL